VTKTVGEMDGGTFVPLSTTTTICDFNGSKRSVIDGRGLITNFIYDDNQRLTGVVHPDESYKVLEYDDHGNLTKETNENGVTTFHEYDALNRRTKTTVDLDGDETADARHAGITHDPTTWEPIYQGDLVMETSYNFHNQVLSQTDPLGKVTANTYDSAGRLTSVNDGGYLTTFAYGANSGGGVFDVSGFKPTLTTDARGKVTTVVYDDLYRATSQTVTDGGTTSTTYDAAGRPLTVTDALNRTTTHTYDAAGNRTSTTYPDGTSVAMIYTHHGKVWKTINEMDVEAVTYYDGAGRAVKTEVEVGGQQVITESYHDGAGNVIAVKDPLGRMTYTHYDNRNRAREVFLPPVWDAEEGEYVQPRTHTVYDAVGQVTQVTDPLGHVSRKDYDRGGRVWKTTDPYNNTTRMAYDAKGNVLKTKDALGRVVTNTYDSHGRLVATVDAAGIANEFGYDAAGNRTSVKDGLDNETTFVYDMLNRLTSQTFANGDTTSFTYNAVQKLSQTDANGVTTSYTYDDRDRLLTVTAPGLNRVYEYDDGGRILSVMEAGKPEATVNYSYDELGRVLTESSYGVTHEYTYDLAGNRILAEYGTGRTVQTSYDAQNRPETIAEAGRLTVYGYDLAGRAAVMVGGNGQVTENLYDAVGRLTNRTLFQNIGNRTETGVQAEFGWAHDAVGNVVAQHEKWPGSPERSAQVRVTAMTYDGANRLLTETISDPQSGVTTTTYGYDAANNRTSKTVTGGSEPGWWEYDYNDVNQLLAWEKRVSENGAVLKTAALEYDDNGNRTSQQISGEADGGGVNPPNAGIGTTSYTWDAQNRLTGVTMPDGKAYHYTYDYRTRRIGTEREASGGATEQHTAIVFSGGLSLAEYESATEQSSIADPSLSTVHYVRGPDMGGGVGGLLYSLRGGSAAKYNLSNGRGDIVAQSDASAALTWTASYEAGGKRTKETGTNADKQRANTKDEDPTGLLNEGFRYRDLETMVWLSRDPAGFVNGPNVYAYVRQNPWTAWDPHGLADEKKQKADAIKQLAPIPAPFRLPFAKTAIDAKIQERMGQSRGIKGVRDWIADEAGFSKKVQYNFLDTYLDIDGKHKSSIEMSQKDVYESGISLSLQRSPEFNKALENNTFEGKGEWTFYGPVLAGADTTATLGTFTANVNATVTSQLVKGKDGKMVPAWSAKGNFTVTDRYDFNVTDSEVARAINDGVAGVNKGPYDGRSQSGEIKTFIMSRVPGKAFDVTSGPVSFSQTSLQPTAQIITNAGTYQSSTEYR
jgi:RHS repeat-associated protein